MVSIYTDLYFYPGIFSVKEFVTNSENSVAFPPINDKIHPLVIGTWKLNPTALINHDGFGYKQTGFLIKKSQHGCVRWSPHSTML
jgi:hypothetical protein